MLRKVITSDKHYIDACLVEDISVVCVNKETKKNKSMPFKVMYDNNNLFWLRNETYEYYLSNEDITKLQERLAKFNSQWGPSVIIKSDRPAMPEVVNNTDDSGWGKGHADFALLTENERMERMKACKDRLDALIAQKPRQEQLITEALVETTRDVVLHNHAAIMNAMNLSEEKAKEQTKNMVESTRDLVKMSSQLISTNIFNDDLMNTLVSKSNGTIIQHMTRTYLEGLAFLTYYNNLVSSSSIIKKLRIAFNEKYLSFYQSLLPHVHPEDITLEKVFLGGMRAIPAITFYDWATGFLLHDIGKAAAVEYHEGELSYNHDIVMEHVKVGYTAIMNKTNYAEDTGLITGYHHEYYGDPSGYGFFRIGLEQYKKQNPHARQDFCIAYDVKPMKEYAALGYFPAKLLEIIDVFDALTDPNRKYRKALTRKEAFVMMREEFINKHQKIDLILFDLFSKFANETSSAGGET